ncbi:myb-related transcription factor, partner of profilin-like [Gadus macrocephalus]|uniref:myb-related transcription factor, partner of profilin-like n=1 Tax=Gadus macrocephalus TaxID=80720 RepID=UPI0028CB8E26|nr:myb-related transcription factor, partner of profilin-like [Gadus macrocephalus]
MMADLPGARKERFTREETDLLVRAVKDREMTLYGDGRNPPKIASVKAAWEEIAIIVSEAGQHRTSLHCRKRCNDVRRRGKAKLAANSQARQKTGGGSGSYQDLTPVENIAASTLTAESVEGFGGFEVGTQPDAPAVQPQASQEEDPGLGTSAHGAAEGAARRTQSRRRGSSASSMRPQDHPFLQLQQTGFDMLERELAGMRRDTNTSLDRVAMLLRPLGRIASSLDRIATAMERAWPPNDPPPPPVVPLLPPVVPLPPPIPSPSTRSTRSISSIATPGPSFVESRLGRRKGLTEEGENN